MGSKKKPPAESQDRLWLQEARWRAVLDSVQDAVISIDATGRVTLFNRAAERIFGWAAGEVLGRNVSMLMPAPYREEHDGYLEAYRNTGVPKAIGRSRYVHALRQNGEVFSIELSVSEAPFENEAAYLAIIRDVSEREMATETLRTSEAARKASEARSTAIIEMAVDGIVTIDERGIIDSFNPAASRMFGYAAEEVIGCNVNVLMPEPYSSEHDGYIATYLRTGARRIVGIGREVTGRRKDGTIFPIYLAVSEILLERKRLFTALVQDLSERRRAEMKLREMEKTALERERLADIGAITAQIVHDLGNPLAAVSMQAQLIVRRARRDANQPVGSVLKAAETILSTIKHLDSLVREFLEFAHEQRLKLASVDLATFLREVIALWLPVAADHGITFTLALPKENVCVAADAEKLRRVFDNLIKNAVEAMGSGPGSLTIRVADPGDHSVRISVADTGPGIPQNLDIFRLFETTKPFGTGLGLAIARQILSAHGGGIEVAEGSPHGAVFNVDLPRGGPRFPGDEDLAGRR